MGRKRDPNSRRSRATARKAEAAARGLSDDRCAPNQRVIALRDTFSFVTPTKGPDGRGGSIDQDICDAVGQLHALGLLDGQIQDAQDLRDCARDWGHGYAMWFKSVGVRTCSFERTSRSDTVRDMTTAEHRFHRMNDALRQLPFEQQVLLDLVVDPIIGNFADDPFPIWAKALIDEALLKRGKLPTLMKFPDSHDRHLFEAAVRGMAVLCDAGLQQRRAAA